MLKKIASVNHCFSYPAMYGCLFTAESEAAFSNYRLWESLAYTIAFAYSSFICTAAKIYILIAVLCVGMTGYFFTEWIHYKETKRIANKNAE